MTRLSVAMLQMVSSGINQSANLQKGDQFCREAASLGAEIALFPEMWNIGYSFFDQNSSSARERWYSFALEDEDDYVLHFRKLARELDMAIGLTYLQSSAEGPRNVISLIDRFGLVKMTYAKVHTCDFDLECELSPGSDFFVTDLQTRQGEVSVGAMICYDREFPESARILMLKGAELILVPNACDLEINRISQTRSRAFENMTALIMTNYAAPQANGHSMAFDGIAFLEDESSRDMLIVEGGEDEAVLLANIDLTALRTYRRRETWGNAYRKPETYHQLVDTDVRHPFVRKDARR